MMTIRRRSTIPKNPNKIPKRRKKSIIPWRKDVDKYRRCQPKGPPLPPSCSHSHSKFECSLLGLREMEYFHRKFYYTRNKAQQDAFILRYCQGRSPKRKSSVAQKERKLTVEYFVPARERNVQVCKEAFVGILRVNKSRVNALLKSFYKVDISKDSTGNEQSTLKLQGRCSGRRGGKMKDENELATNSKSLTNIENSNKKNVTIEFRFCQSECQAPDKTTGYSILMVENVQEDKLINHESDNSVYEGSNFDWLNLGSKSRRHKAFDWSPLKRTTHTVTDKPSNGEVENIISALPHPISCDTNSENTDLHNIYTNAANESTKNTIKIPRITLSDQSHVYESKRRRLRKLETIDEKENIYKNSTKEKNNVNYSKPEQKKEHVLLKKKVDKISSMKRKDNKFGQIMRFPLRTLC